MTSVIVPPVDLAPGMPSRVVTISATDVTEGGQSMAGQMVRFALSDTLDVTSGGDVIAKTQAEVVLDTNGEGSIRLPVYDEAVKTWCGDPDWAIIVTTTWGSQKAIRVPAGTSDVALSALPPVRPLRGREKQWAITGASVTVSEGGSAGGTVTLESGVLRFALTIPRGDWNRGSIGAGGNLDTLTGSASVGYYPINSVSVTGTPVTKLGTLEVQYNSASARTIQVFTDADPTGATQFSRVYSGGAWGPWQGRNWDRGLLPAGRDFNTITTLGAHSVQFANHPNQPAGSIGVLEVLAASTERIQRFTTREANPRQFMRASATSSTWHPWQGPFTFGSVTGLESRVSTLELSSGTGTPREPVEPKAGTLTPRPASSIMTTLSHDRSHGWNAYGSVLSETWDDGQTWTPVPLTGSNVFAGSTIESVMELDNGDLLVTAYRGSSGEREVWVSSGYPAGPATFAITMTSRARSIKYTSAWSQFTYGRIVLINEYGPKTGALWDGQEVLPGENARYTFLSRDYGRTWQTVFDLNTYLTGQMGRLDTDNQHLHGVAWDPWWDRIWVTYGDNVGGNGSNGITFSDDLGATWHSAHHYQGGTNPPHQVVGILPMPRCVLFAGDMGPDIVRIDRSEGKHPGTYPTPTAFDSGASGKHLCQGIQRAKREGDDAPALFAFSAEGAIAPSFIATTLDGYQFAELWRDSANQPSGFGARNIVGPTLRGEVIMASNDQRAAPAWSEVRMPAPGY